MIGQNKLKKIIENQVLKNNFPRFSIIVGDRGSGKKTLCKYINEALNVFWCFEPDNKVETVRNVIAESYKRVSPTCYVFTDVDNMSVSAKNALLKVTEEPPNGAYFIMTVTNLDNVLPTIKSRASIYYMQPYSKEELATYYHDYAEDRKADEREVVLRLCNNPGEIDLLCKNGAVALSEFAEKVVDNVAETSGANAFKIANSISFKDGEDGFDFELFMRAFRNICTSRLQQDRDRYIIGVHLATMCISQMNITGINKKALFDIFILDIRKAWG